MARQLAVCAVVLSTKMLPEPLLTHVNSPLIASSLSSAICFLVFGVKLDLFYSSFWVFFYPTGKYLLDARHCAKPFISIISFNSHDSL